MTDTTLVDVKETARLLSVSTDTVYALAAERKLPVVRIGRRILIQRSKLEQWAEHIAALGVTV